MTHPLVETVARAIFTAHHGPISGWDKATLASMQCVSAATAALNSILSNGYAIVPLEPTEEMCEAALNADWGDTPTDHQIKRAEWSAMLSSAPKVVP